MPPYQQRVIDEKAELDKRLSALTEFINNNATYRNLERTDQYLLSQQQMHMLALSRILFDRISRFT